MPLQFGVALRNAQLDQITTVIGTIPILKIITGTQPATCATAESGTVLSTLNLPNPYMTAAAAAVKAKTGVWAQASAANTGVAGYWRIYDTAGTTCHMQGSITVTGGGGDMTVDNTSFGVGQSFTINTFSITAGNGP